MKCFKKSQEEYTMSFDSALIHPLSLDHVVFGPGENTLQLFPIPLRLSDFAHPVSGSDRPTFGVLSFQRPYAFILRLLILSMLGHVPKMLRRKNPLSRASLFYFKTYGFPSSVRFMENCLRSAEYYRTSKKKLADMLCSAGEKRSIL